MSKPRDIHPSIQWTPWQGIGITSTPSEFPNLVDEFEEKIITLLNYDGEDRQFIFDQIEFNVIGYIQFKHLWTKDFVKRAREKYSSLRIQCSNLYQNMDEIFRDEGLLKLIQDQLMELADKGRYPYGEKEYVDSERFLDIFQNYIFDFEGILKNIVKNIDSHFPESIKGNDQGCEAELLHILIYELIYIFESHFNPDLTASEETFSDNEIRENRLFFVGTILFHFGIQTERTISLTYIPENKEKLPPAGSNNRLARIIDEAFNQYQTNLKTPKK